VKEKRRVNQKANANEKKKECKTPPCKSKPQLNRAYFHWRDANLFAFYTVLFTSNWHPYSTSHVNYIIEQPAVHKALLYKFIINAFR
jgi:hypothetical protein